MFDIIVSHVAGILPGSADKPNMSSERPGSRADEEYAPAEWRVRQLLTEHGGAMWQNDIRGRTGWSASKTSRVLSRMEAEGALIRRRIGREKVALLPGHESAIAFPEPHKP